ncbi:AAA family ATPase [Candidatus Halobeggiatoa sp. HSG11]|nr:AAA family ATPase [Candidatus Halobeggiatoa sp. HSG11]
MKFTFKNLGIFDKETTIELGDLTIICGDNNTGKTYASYAIFGFLDTWSKNISFDIPEDELKKLYNDGSIQLDLNDFAQTIDETLIDLSKDYIKYLPTMFSSHEDFFNTTQFKAFYSPNNYKDNSFKSSVKTANSKDILLFDKQENSSILYISLLIDDENISPPSFSRAGYFIGLNIGRALLGNYFSNPFILSSERAGIYLFHRELDINKNILVERLQNSDKKFEATDYFDMFEEATSRYAKPIQNGIDFVRDIIDVHSKKKSQLIKEHPEFVKMMQEIIGGEYKVESNQILFVFRKGRRKERVPVYMASSAVKSMLELYFYIISMAKKGDILMIDEPELNLHPANQRKLARLFARLVKVGIKVFITTHSDYLIKELNNLIMLSDKFEYKDEVLKKLKYSAEDNLPPSYIKAYIAENKTLTLAPITKYGIEVKSFDKEISDINCAFTEITLAKGI